MYLHSYTYGELPPRADFDEGYAWEVGENTTYQIRLGPVSGADPKWDGIHSPDELYELIEDACKAFHETGEGMDDEESDLSMASSVLETLRLEWI